MTVVHIAAEPKFGGLYQECSRCGYVFQDLTGTQPMVPEDQAGLGVPYWTVGGRVAVNGNASWALLKDIELDPGETECRPAS